MGFFARKGSQFSRRKVYRGSAGESPERWDEYWGDRVPEAFGVRSDHPIAQLVDATVPRSSRILEAGCGSGRWLVHLLGEGHDVAGVDFAPAAVARVRRAMPDLDVRQANIDSLPWPDHHFDAALCVGLVEHIEQGPQKALRELVRVVRPGGLLFVSVPVLNAVRQLQIRLRADDPQRGQPFYQYAFSRSEMDALVTAAGAIPEKHGYYDHLFGLRLDFRAFDRLYGRLVPDRAPASRPYTGPSSVLVRLRRAARRAAEHQALGPIVGHMIMVCARLPGDQAGTQRDASSAVARTSAAPSHP